MPLHSLKIDLHSLLTLKWNHYLQKSHRSCQPVTYISQSWALDPIPDLNIIVSGSQLQGSYHSLQFVYPAKAVTSSQQTIYYTDNNTYSNIWIQPEIGTIKCCTVGHIPMGFHGHIWAHIGHRCQWAAPPCFWVEPHGPSSPASSAENWVLGWVKVGTEIRISRIIKNQFHKVRPWFADSTNVFFHFCRAAASANRTCSSGSLTISLSVAVAQRPTSNSDSWRIGPHESIATIHRLAKFSSSQGSLHHIQQYTPPTECHPNKGSRTYLTYWRIHARLLGPHSIIPGQNSYSVRSRCVLQNLKAEPVVLCNCWKRMKKGGAVMCSVRDTQILEHVDLLSGFDFSGMKN